MRAALALLIALLAAGPVRAETTPPETTIESGPADAGTTTDATPIFAFGSSEPDSTFACSVDGAAFEPCDSPATLSPLLDGPHTFAVGAVDGTGNADPTPATRTFRVDATPPNGTITKAPAAAVETTHKRAKVSFTFLSSEPGTSFMCSLDGIAATPCNSPKGYNVGKGEHRFELLASDPAHNPDLTPATVDFKVKHKRKHH